MKHYELGLYEKAMPDSISWRERLETAGRAGFDYVEISIDETDARLSRLDWTRDERRSLIADMYDTGTPIRSMCLSGHRKYPLGSHDTETRRRSLEIMEKALILADDVGIRMIQLAGYDVYYEEGDSDTRAYFLENLIKSAELAAKYGILMGFETMETPFMNTVEKSMDYVNRVNSPYLGVYPDIGNLTNAAVTYKTDVLADLEKGAGHLVAMHLKPTKPGQFRDLYFDDPTQHVDFPAAIQKAWSLGVRRYVTEMWHLGRDDWRDNIQTAHDRMAAILSALV